MDDSSKRLLLEKDRQFVWHPFTQMKDYAEMDHLLVEKADGVFLYDADGNQYYDTISSWWVNIHGHGHPRIKRAIADQLDSMDHVMFSGLTHRTGIELAEKLTEIVPDGLSHVFYSDNGSTAVEVAMKMSFQYWQQIGNKQKTKYAFLENSYHGDTIGAVSVGGVKQYHSLFKPLLFEAYQIPSPNVHAWPDPTEQGASECIKQCLIETEKLFQDKHAEIAAVVVEPMIQAAGGMIIYPAKYLKGLRNLCTRYRIHLIADEVAVGFGRTGRMFGCNHAGISPDLICLSKGLTAGVIPLAATLCTDEIYMAFYDDYHTLKTFFHGHSFTGNPVAAAVALMSLEIFADERVLERVQETSAALNERMQRLESHEHAGRIRSLGMVGAFDLLADKSSGRSFDSKERMGNQVYWAGLKEGLILRPLGDTIYFWLPLSITAAQVIDIAERTERVLHRLGL